MVVAMFCSLQSIGCPELSTTDCLRSTHCRAKVHGVDGICRITRDWSLAHPRLYTYTARIHTDSSFSTVNIASMISQCYCGYIDCENGWHKQTSEWSIVKPFNVSWLHIQHMEEQQNRDGTAGFGDAQYTLHQSESARGAVCAWNVGPITPSRRLRGSWWKLRGSGWLTPKLETYPRDAHDRVGWLQSLQEIIGYRRFFRGLRFSMHFGIGNQEPI